MRKARNAHFSTSERFVFGLKKRKLFFEQFAFLQRYSISQTQCGLI